MYSIHGHGKMIRDSVRIGAYEEALRRTVKPGDAVLDLGAGTGIFSLIACRLGARRVYAIESGSVAELGREIAAENGCADRIEFIPKRSARANLPEPANIVVSDLRGVLPMFGRHLPDIIDARKRLMAEDGCLIPVQDTLMAAVVNAPDLHEQFVSPWTSSPCGLDFTPVQRYAVNHWTRCDLYADQVHLKPKPWSMIDYRRIDSPNVQGEVSWHVRKEGLVHGILCWFDTLLIDGVGFSNAPGNRKLIYGQAFFPFMQPIQLGKGDAMSIRISANLLGDDYVWRWDTRVSGDKHSEQNRVAYRQSTYFGQPLSPERLRKKAARFVPHLNLEGRIDGWILRRMDGEISLDRLAESLRDAFPERFPTDREALNRVADLSEKYSR